MVTMMQILLLMTMKKEAVIAVVVTARVVLDTYTGTAGRRRTAMDNQNQKDTV